MKVLVAMIVALILIFSILGLVTSTSTPVAQIAYGDSTSGRLNDTSFEWVYEFAGEMGDVVQIELLVESAQDNLSANIYLIRPDGESTYDSPLQSRDRISLFIQLHHDGPHLIVVERYGGRRYDGTGNFELTLNKAEPRELESSWQGVLTVDDYQSAHLFYAENTGTYRVSMDQPDRYSPALRIYTLRPGQDGMATVAELDVALMGRVSFEVQLRGHRYYVVMPYRPYNSPPSLTGNSPDIRYDISITPLNQQSSPLQ
jgi:hypothetical protein